MTVAYLAHPRHGVHAIRVADRQHARAYEHHGWRLVSMSTVESKS